MKSVNQAAKWIMMSGVAKVMALLLPFLLTSTAQAANT